MDGKLRKIIRILLALCIAMMFCVPAQAAQEPEFRLDMDNLNLQKGVGSSLVVSMINAQEAKLIRIEGLENFDVVSQNQSISTTNINGNSIHQKKELYAIMPKTTGQFTLKAYIQYNGKTYETNMLQVTVGEGQSHDNGAADSDLFVRTILSKDEAYLGEKVVVTYELYTRQNIDNFGFTDYSAIDGVMAKEIPEDQLKAEQVYLDGVRYTKYQVKQMILDPLKAGTYTIPSFHIQVNVVTDDGLGGFFRIDPSTAFNGFFGLSKPMYLQTEAKELTVKPLPSEGKPKDFSGIVGNLQLDGDYSREEVNYGDSLSLQVTASGNCNLDGLKKIFSGALPGFKVYETQKNATETVRDNQYHVQKEFEAILVPEKNGTLDIAPVSISYFNPDTEKYERAEIPGTTIKVLGDMPPIQANGGADSQPAAMETVKINQISYAEPSKGQDTIQISKHLFFGSLIGVGVLLVVMLIVRGIVRNGKKQDVTLKSLYRQMMNARDVHEVYRLFSDMMKHCYHISLKASPLSVIQSSIPNADLAQQVVEIMNYAESNKEKDCACLKDKIRSVYGMISRQHKSQ